MRIYRAGIGQDLIQNVIDAQCVVGGTDANGDTAIASCGATLLTGTNPGNFVPIVQNGVTIGYSASGSLPVSSSNMGLYLGLGVGVLVLALFMGKR